MNRDLLRDEFWDDNDGQTYYRALKSADFWVDEGGNVVIGKVNDKRVGEVSPTHPKVGGATFAPAVKYMERICSAASGIGAKHE